MITRISHFLVVIAIFTCMLLVSTMVVDGAALATHPMTHHPTSHTTTHHPKHSKTILVKIVSDEKTVGRYVPKVVTVHLGQKIVFKNVSNAIHTVTAMKGGSFDPKLFNSGNIGTGGHTWTYTAKHVGKFKYGCIYHPLMHGEIIVKR
jgi:plastocyanin